MEHPAPLEAERRLSDKDQDALRRLLLIELSVLRRRYAGLFDDHQAKGETGAFPATAADCDVAPSAAIETSSEDEQTGALCQSDRDAIEALFHSIDDFTREFNEGKGIVEHDDVVTKIMRDFI
ncbi:hypothetical protein Q4I28_000785 [Leishmania naiffi]|uniref:Uncharacterized protein n=1 Tax=Leishmania naiffi TaxID=5678 RepID=A0AAW3C820_9TRYP